MKFPRLVYKSAAIYKGVNDADEFDSAIADGWFASVPEALATKVEVVKEKEPEKEPEQKENSAPTRAEMEQKATELGIKFDGRTTDAKLLKLINEAI